VPRHFAVDGSGEDIQLMTGLVAQVIEALFLGNLEGQHPSQQEQGQQNHGTKGTVRFGQADRRAGVGFSHEQAGDREG
jgi:hypothetical protein